MPLVDDSGFLIRCNGVLLRVNRFLVRHNGVLLRCDSRFLVRHNVMFQLCPLILFFQNQSIRRILQGSHPFCGNIFHNIRSKPNVRKLTPLSIVSFVVSEQHIVIEFNTASGKMTSIEIIFFCFF